MKQQTGGKPKKPKSYWGAPIPTITTEDGELSLAEAAKREREREKAEKG